MDNTPTNGQPDVPGGATPGDTITPASTPVVAQQPAAASPAPSVSLPAPEAQPQVAVPQTADSFASQPDQAYQPEQNRVGDDDDAIVWTAAEFIAHNKSASWYGILALVVIVLAALVFLFTRDKISTAVVIIAGIALGGYGARQPQQRRYVLDDQGLGIGDKYLPYSLFRSFSVIDEGDVSSISFYPLKRFGQLTTIYYNPEDEEAIVDLLAGRLPIDDRTHDTLEKFLKRIRF